MKRADLDAAFVIFQRRAEDLEEDELKDFSKRLIEYLNTQWRQGVYAVQDWNLYDLNLLLVPSTNNGNEGQNRRFKENFGIHPKIWDFFLTLSLELESRSADIPLILLGSLIPKQDENYHSLKVEREIAKANYEAGLLSLDTYMGKIGALSIKAGKAKTVDDDEDSSIPTMKPVKISNHSSKNRPGNRGRRQVFTSKPQSSDLFMSSGGTASASVDTSIISSCWASSMPVLGSNVRNSSAAPTSGNLPWPLPTGIVPPTSSLPSTASRTTASAAPTSVTAGCSVRPTVTELSAVSKSNDSLMRHIEKYKIGLKQRPAIPGDGNCWYNSCIDLIQLHNIAGFSNAHQLRLAVTNLMKRHPNKRQWIRTLFAGKARGYNKFIIDQSKDGVFVDNNGIAVLLTAEVLGLKIHLVGTSNDQKNPVTPIGDASDDQTVFHIGYYQDTTDVRRPGTQGYKAGHYQSLEAIEGEIPRCCSSDTVTASVLVPSLNISAAPLVNDVLEKVKHQEKILFLVYNDAEAVSVCLDRLQEIERVTVKELLKTKICDVLFNDVRPLYPVTTANGKKCRRLLNRYQDLCKSHPEFNNQNLPDITDVEDEIDDQQPQINFEGLFTRIRTQESVVLSEMARSNISPLDFQSVPALSSTLMEGCSATPTGNPDESCSAQAVSSVCETVLDSTVADVSTPPSKANPEPTANRKKKKKIPPLSSVFSLTQYLELPASEGSVAVATTKLLRRGRSRPVIVHFSESDSLSSVDISSVTTNYIESESSVNLTPPPPSPPSPPKKRGRGRPRRDGN